MVQVLSLLRSCVRTNFMYKKKNFFKCSTKISHILLRFLELIGFVGTLSSSIDLLNVIDQGFD